MRLKRAIKQAVLAAGRLVFRPTPSTRRVVFCYHSVHPNRPYSSTKPETFDRHIQWLKEHCQLVSLVDLVTGSDTRRTDKPMVAITFDDGHADNHLYAFPILARHRVPATFFITAGFIERESKVLQRLQHLLRCGSADLVPLDWAQVRELRAGGMDIGSHTYSHPNLARLSRAQVEDELRTSRDLISDRLAQAIDLFAYPFGKPRVHFTQITRDVVGATGYRIAAAVTFRGVHDSDSVLQIPRFFADGDDLAKLEAKIYGSYELIGWWQDRAPLSWMKMVSPEDFER